MNREQAGHLLDAYAMMVRHDERKATDALREVILDQMADMQLVPPPTTSAPGITLPNFVPGTTHPVFGNWNTVTCGTGDA